MIIEFPPNRSNKIRFHLWEIQKKITFFLHSKFNFYGKFYFWGNFPRRNSHFPLFLSRETSSVVSQFSNLQKRKQRKMLILLSGIRHFGQILERRSCYGQKHFQSWVCSLDMFYTGMTHFFYYLILQSVIGRVNLLVLVLVTRVIFLRGTRILGIFFQFRVYILEYSSKFSSEIKARCINYAEIKNKKRCYKVSQKNSRKYFLTAKCSYTTHIMWVLTISKCWENGCCSYLKTVLTVIL